MAEAEPKPMYRCLLCTTPYKDPRKLPCDHTFCCRCLTSYIEEHVTSDEDRHFFPCPVCDSPISPSDVSTDVSTWAECFPINTLFLGPIAEESDVHLCAPCQRGEESNQAEVWCTDCDEKLCKQCRKYHERNKASAKHRLVSISRTGGEVREVLVNEICPSHNGKPLDVYCVDHSEMCCSVCVSVSHRLCNNVKPIEDVIKTTKAGQQNRETEWKELRDETRKMVDDDDLGMALITSSEQDVSAEMTTRIHQAKDKLDSLNAKFQSGLKDTCKTLRQKLSARRMCVYTFHINAENSYLLMSHSAQQISERHKFFLREQTRNQISGQFRRFDKNTKHQPNRFDVNLKIGTTIDEIMKMTTLGNIDVSSTLSPVSQNANDCIETLIGALTPSASTPGEPSSTSDFTGSLQYLTVQTTPVATAVDVWTSSVSCVKTVDGSTLEGPRNVWLTGGIFTDNNELLMADYHNSRLLLFDNTYTTTRAFDIDGQPTDIARGRADDEVIVAVNKTIMLKFKLQNGQLSLINKVWFPCDISRIAVLGDNILVSTPDSVRVVTGDGKVTKTIQVTNTIQQNGTNSFIATSPSNAKLYYKDNDYVVCRRLDSTEELFRYRHPGLWDPRSVGIDRDDNVYVCGFNSGNVHLVSADGSRGRVLVSKLSAITYPWCVIAHPTRHEFVVTSYGEWPSLEVYRFYSK